MKNKVEGSFAAGKIWAVREVNDTQVRMEFLHGPYLISKASYLPFSKDLIVGTRVTVVFFRVSSQKVRWLNEEVDMPTIRIISVSRGVRMKRLFRLASAQ